MAKGFYTFCVVVRKKGLTYYLRNIERSLRLYQCSVFVFAQLSQ